jgi:hypothetical protein
MSKGMKVLTFKDEIYDYETLIMYYCDDTYGEKFKDGEVINSVDGEIFDIEVIIDNYIKRNQGILGDLTHLTYANRSRFKRMVENKIKAYRMALFNKKLEDNTITKEELEELFFMEDNRDIKKELINREGISNNLISKFVKLNLDNPLPQELSITDVGRFHRLVELVVNENKIFKKPHGNSKEITKKELMEYLHCSIATYKSFLSTMNKYSLVRKYIPSHNRVILFINPLYAHRDLIISKELYSVFKDVIEAKLDKKISKYMEFIYSIDDSSGCVVYNEK